MQTEAIENTKETNFINRWAASGAAERANYQLFLSELCDLIGVARPDPTQADDARNAYVFERAVTFHNPDSTTSNGRIDLYKRDHFILEAKQGSGDAKSNTEAKNATPKGKVKRGTAKRGTHGWDDAMLAARGQAEQYARALSAGEPQPPFLVVVDVGFSIELYSEFSRSGKTYLPYPDARSHRIALRELESEEVRERLRLVWTDPLALDPAQRSARVTRDVARRLAALAKSLEESGHAAEAVTAFLMRAIFTLFAEDVNLIRKGSFTELLERLRGNVAVFPDMMESLWATMNTGGFSPALSERLLRFNGGLFEESRALPLTEEQLALLIEAARADWRDVEPAIFGTLLEQALDPRERAQLGAHYTPRAYVERLVLPTVIEPLREEWRDVQAGAVTSAKAGKLDEAVAEVKAFHRRLCEVRVLDPSCGSGNFLYVTLEHMKRLEGEVLTQLEDFGRSSILEYELATVDPHQLLGIEVNERAAGIADLVLWIGYLQWHFRTRGDARPREPVLQSFRNIVRQDAILDYDGLEAVQDADGYEVTRWDGRTYKSHPVTGEAVPDETARVRVMRPVNPRRREWAEADYIVGNPPFIGNSRMRAALGDGYTEALRATYPDVPESSDLVMYWWHKAAELVRAGKMKRFGFITTNSIKQTFNRRVVERHMTAKEPLSLRFVVPDHPWVDSSDGAAVRISMTVAEAGEVDGVLARIVSESGGDSEGRNVELLEQRGNLHADLTIGADVASVQPLKADEGISSPGVKLHGAGFIITSEEAERLGLSRIVGLEQHIKPYRHGRDLSSTSRGVMVIDLDGLQIDEVRERFPAVYQHILERVKPERAQNNERYRRENWWLFGRRNTELRAALKGLPRYISTPETAKHRFFVFLDQSILPDNMLINIALADAYFLGVLSSCVHIAWALATGGTLEDRPRYNKSRCFDTFPFPDANDEQKQRIRELGERLDSHRKRQQAEHPRLTMTEMYNVLERLRAGTELTEDERRINNLGLVTTLREIHDQLDAVVCAAYGWSPTLTNEQLLEALVSLNRERTLEEKNGVVRWLRPEYQHPTGASQTAFGTDYEVETLAVAPKAERVPFPKGLADQARVVRAALAAEARVVTAAELSKRFQRAPVARVEELLETLVSLGQARVTEGHYVA